MDFDATGYADAIRHDRYFDAATDAAVHDAWKGQRDPLARALLILAAAHLHASRGNLTGAEEKLERAGQYLEEAEGNRTADALRNHREAALAAVRDGGPLPRLPVGTLERA